METLNRKLPEALNMGSREHVAVVGGGGKSTLCLAMAKALAQTGVKIVSTTTTKVRQEETSDYPRLLLFCFGEVETDAVSVALDEVGSVFVGRKRLENGKIEGISMVEADGIFSLTEADYVINEADGAAGCPLKAPASHEPVIPKSTSLTIAVMGLSALGRPVGPSLVFRPALFKALTGLEEGDILAPKRLVNVFDPTAGLFKNTPDSTRRVVFLNQLDLLPDHREARDLAGRVLSKWPSIDRVILGSFRRNEFITIS